MFHRRVDRVLRISPLRTRSYCIFSWPVPGSAITDSRLIELSVLPRLCSVLESLRLRHREEDSLEFSWHGMVRRAWYLQARKAECPEIVSDWIKWGKIQRAAYVGNTSPTDLGRSLSINPRWCAAPHVYCGVGSRTVLEKVLCEVQLWRNLGRRFKFSRTRAMEHPLHERRWCVQDLCQRLHPLGTTVYWIFRTLWFHGAQVSVNCVPSCFCINHGSVCYTVGGDYNTLLQIYFIFE